MAWLQYDNTGAQQVLPTAPNAANGALGLIRLAGDLGGTAKAPQAIGLRNFTLPAAVANGLLRRNNTVLGWDFQPYGAFAGTVCQGDDPRLIAGTERTPSFLRCRLSTADASSGSIAPSPGLTYFTFMGRTGSPMTPPYIRFQVTTAGGGAQTAEVGFFASPSAPNRGDQTLRAIVATGSITDCTTTGVKVNLTAFQTTIPAGTFLWAAVRISMGGGAPSLVAVLHDMEQGEVLLGPNVSLVGASEIVGAVIPVSVAPTFSGINLYAAVT